MLNTSCVIFSVHQDPFVFEESVCAGIRIKVWDIRHEVQQSVLRVFVLVFCKCARAKISTRWCLRFLYAANHWTSTPLHVIEYPIFDHLPSWDSEGETHLSCLANAIWPFSVPLSRNGVFAHSLPRCIGSHADKVYTFYRYDWCMRDLQRKPTGNVVGIFLCFLARPHNETRFFDI